MPDGVDLYFELHIRPLFRPTDRVHMIGRFDLWKYEHVADNVNLQRILTRVQLPPDDMTLMPPLNVGGPWPQEWIDLLKRWDSTGRKRLEKGVGTYTATWSQAKGRVTLVATGELTTPNYAVWLDVEMSGSSPYEFVLYQKPGGEFEDAFQSDIRFADPNGSVKSVVVHDGNGAQTVPVTQE